MFLLQNEKELGDKVQGRKPTAESSGDREVVLLTVLMRGGG
jgi:hypothetical protein